MTRATALAAVVAAAAAVPVRADASLFFLFRPTSAATGDQVSVRLGGTPPTFQPVRQAAAVGPPIRVYLVRNDVAPAVRSRFDHRVVYITAIRSDRNVHGIATFVVPRIAPGLYAAAAWCPSCAAYSNGRTFFTFPLDTKIVPRFRRLMFLHVHKRTR